MMNFDNITTKKIKNPASFGILVLFISIIVVIFASQLLYAQTVDLLTENLRQRILTISVTVASNINSKDLEALRVEDDWQKPEWSRIVNRLNKAKYSNEDIVFMYIFRKQQEDPTKMEFVADADSIDPYVNLSVDPSINKAKYSNEDIVFMYIFRKQQEDPTKMEFVADADSIDPYVNLSVDPSKNI